MRRATRQQRSRWFRPHYLPVMKMSANTMSCPLDYGFISLPWQAECWHWHTSSDMPFASAQASLQYFFPFRDTQLQAGCPHLDVGFMEAPFIETCTSAQADPWRVESAYHVKRLQNLVLEHHLYSHATPVSRQQKPSSVPFCSLLKEQVKRTVDRQFQRCRACSKRILSNGKAPA